MATNTAALTVNTNTVLNAVTPYSFGINTAAWDDLLVGNPNTVTFLQKANYGFIRYPGGSTADFFHWAGTTYKTAGGAINPAADPTQQLPPYLAGPNLDAYLQAYTPNPGNVGGTKSLNNFDNWMTQVVQPLNAKPVITVNFGSSVTYDSTKTPQLYQNQNINNPFYTINNALVGTIVPSTNPYTFGAGDPVEAASWVAYAKAKNYGVQYWCVGNENYGDGSCSKDATGNLGNPASGWEVNGHAAPVSPMLYANTWLTYRSAMKAADPTCKVGIVLTAYKNWPDANAGGPVSFPYTDTNNSTTTGDWNHVVLSIVGSLCDFAEIHWYANGPTPDGSPLNDINTLSSPYVQGAASIADMVSYTRGLFTHFCTTNPNGTNIPQLWTEFNTVSYGKGPQTLTLVNPLFYVDAQLCFLEQSGVLGASLWDLREGPNPFIQGNKNLGRFPNQGYGDYGLFNSGATNNTNLSGYTVPPNDYWWPTFYGSQLLGKILNAGDSIVSMTLDGNNPLMRAHAVKTAGGNINVMLTNTDSVNDFSVTLTLAGYTAGVVVSGMTYGKNYMGLGYGQQAGAIANNGKGLTSVSGTVTGGTTTVYVAPSYSLTVLTFTPASTIVTPPAGVPTTFTVNGTATAIATGTGTAVNPGGTMTFSTNGQASANATNITAVFTVTDPLGAVTTGATVLGLTFVAGVPLRITATFSVPGTAAIGVWTLKAKITSPDGLTTYVQDTAGTPFTVASAVSKTPNISPATLAVSPIAITMGNLTDPTTNLTLKQAAFKVNDTDANNAAIAPASVIVDPITFAPITLNNESTQQSVLQSLQGAGSLTANNPFKWLWSDAQNTTASPPLLPRNVTADTGWLPSNGLQTLGLYIDLQSVQVTSGNPNLQFYLDTQMANGSFVTLWNSNPQGLTTTDQALYEYVGISQQAGNASIVGQTQVALPFTDKIRVRWVITPNGATGIACLFSINIWGK